jgi:outer membrane cobalamin receptor
MYINFFRAGRALPALLIFSSLLLLPNELKGQDSDSWDSELTFTEDEGITVTESPQTTQQMRIIDKEEIERHNAADLADLLNETLNLGLTRYGSYGNMANINLRGFDSKRVAFLIDGVPLNSAQNGEFDINQLGLGGIERVEVIYGGSDTKYNVSGALGGVINIITVKKQKQGLKLGASVSNLSVLPGEYRDRSEEKQAPHWEDLADTQNYSVSASYGGSGFSVSANAFANRAENHYCFSDTYNRTRRKDNNEVWDTGAAASLMREFAGLSKIIFSPNFYYSDKNIPSSGFSPDVGKQKDMSTRHNLMLDMPRAFHDDFAAEASLVYYMTRRDFESPVGAESRHDQHSATLINRWSWHKGELLILRSGIDYRFIYLDSTEMGLRNRHDGGFYMTAEWKPVNSFLIIPSVKAAITSGGQGGITPVPKLGLLWNVNDSISIKNNYFRSFKFPDFEDLYWTGGGSYGNPNLKSEDGWGGDIGASWRFKKLFSFDSTFFTQWTTDSIHWYSGNSGVWRPENVGEAIFFGLDSKFNIEIPVSLGPVKKLIPTLSYQYLLSYLLSYGYTFASDKRIPYMPSHTIGASLDIPWETGSLLISAHYESQRYTSRENINVLKPHTMLNAIYNQKTGKHISIFAALRNILNESYESFDRYPMPGITLTLGMKLNYDLKGSK